MKLSKLQRGRPWAAAALLAVVLLVALCILYPADVHAAAWSTMPSGTKTPTGNRIPLNMSTAQISYNSSGAKTVNYTTADGGEGKALCVKIPDRTKAYTFTNFCTVKFPKATTIGGRSVDVTIEFTSMTVAAESGSTSLLNSDHLMGFAMIRGLNGMIISVASEDPCNVAYRAAKTIKTKATVVWSDTGAIVDLPFYQGVSDIDAGSTYYKESWEGTSGFGDTFYLWDQNINIKNGNKITSNGLVTEGNDSWYKTGMIAPTLNGQMAMTWQEGDCGTGLFLYSQYQDLHPPVKSADRKMAEEGDVITWTVKQSVGTFYSDTFNKYSSLTLSDTIPKGLTYGEARIRDGDGKDITESGQLTYDPQTRKVKYVFTTSALQNLSLYNGQTFTMTITTRAEQPETACDTLTNKAYSDVSGNTLASNPVNVDVKKPELKITKAAAKKTYRIGEMILYTVTVEQTTEGLSAQNTTVSDALPEHLKLKEAPVLSSSGRVEVDGNNWTAYDIPLKPKEPVTITFQAVAKKVTIDTEVENTAKAYIKADGKDEVKDTAAIDILADPVAVKVSKDWNDDDDAYHIRPKQITAQLLRDGTVLKEEDLSEENGWAHTFTGLTEYKTKTEPYTYEVREKADADGYTSNVEQDGKAWKITNTPIRYNLTITKRIKAEDVYTAHGDATFLYTVTSKANPTLVWNRAITFTKDHLKPGSDGYLSGSAILSLPYGTYVVAEQSALRYQGGITATSGKVSNLAGGKAEAVLGLDTVPETVTFTNEKLKWDRYTHNDVRINKLKK